MYRQAWLQREPPLFMSQSGMLRAGGGQAQRSKGMALVWKEGRQQSEGCVVQLVTPAAWADQRSRLIPPERALMQLSRAGQELDLPPLPALFR